jgi:hypothetical protein
MMDLIRRNDELEQENAIIRAGLSHAVSSLGALESEVGMYWISSLQKHHLIIALAN